MVRAACQLAAALLLAPFLVAQATRQPWNADIPFKPGRTANFAVMDNLHVVCATTWPHCARSAGGFSEVADCVTEPCNWDIFSQPDALDKFLAVMRCMQTTNEAGNLATDIAVANKGYDCKWLFDLIYGTMDIPPALMTEYAAENACEGVTAKKACKKAVTVGRCKLKKGKCKLVKYYPGKCTRLKRRDCKKAMKGGACVAAGGGKCAEKGS